MYSAAPWSMQPRPAVPDEQVRVLDRAVRVGDQGIEPDDGRGVRPGRSRRDAVAAAGLKVSAPGRKSIPRFSPPLARTRSWISSSGSASPRDGSSSTRDQVRHGQPDGPCQLAGQPLGDQRPRTLPGAAELDDVQPVVVRLDETRQRAALAQGRHVACRDHGPHRAASLAEARLGVPVQVRTGRTRGAAAARLALHDDRL